MLTPTVLWAQRNQFILLRVQMRPEKKPDFTITETHMTFEASGVGASGSNTYGFQLIFSEPVTTERCRFRILENEVEFRIQKKNAGSWKRLQSSMEKPHWIKLDFDHFEVSDSEEEEEQATLEGINMDKSVLASLEKELEQQVHMYNKFMNVVNKVKMGYLVAYNVIQWLGYLYIVSKLFSLLARGPDGIAGAYEAVLRPLTFCQLLAFLEIVNSILGLVKGSALASFMQVAGRAFILFFCLIPAELAHDYSVVYLLFMVWSWIELVRYPFYALSVLGIDQPMLTWLRYSMWVPLYPVGFSCEATVIWLALYNTPPEKTWTYELPNVLNFSISSVSIQWIALACVPIIAYSLISHMWVQRKKKLHFKPKKSLKKKKQ